MSVDTVFKPLGPSVLVGTTAVQIVTSANPAGVSTFRVRNTQAVVAYFAYGSASVAAPVAPTAGGPAYNTIGMLPGSIETFELPAASYFIAAAVGGFEMVPGQGA
jgi:hypothetical protein